jgi:hypothetical protein
LGAQFITGEDFNRGGNILRIFGQSRRRDFYALLNGWHLLRSGALR